ncbi:hypothetical protein [Shewanella japonica]|uniref:hypothetical protein n=1 Tax=Shewanella japonica TaxID=93973 RepID=UPI000E75FDA9|nr:hypothetical protein [Shewanella japonica]
MPNKNYSAQKNHPIEVSNEIKNNIYTERYKYILEKIKFLDGLMQKNFSVYFKFTLAICTALSASLVMIIEDKISLDTVNLLIELLFLLEVAASLLIIAITVANIRTWFDYRDDEINFLNKIKCDLNRKKPTIEGLFRWSETYLIIISTFIGLVSILGFFCSEMIITNIGN